VGWLLCPPPVLRVLARLLPNAFVVQSTATKNKGFRKCQGSIM